jgi:phosphoribosylformimino-5-aminoimidazole carboxamide ribotide isomerase
MERGAPMIIIPAIDLKSGKCVRLRQGKMDSSTVFNEEPRDQALKWRDLGASRIHVVDLDGSVAGKPANLKQIEEIVSAVNVPVQVGGGIRNESTIRSYLDIGVDTVILGTISAREPETVRGFMSRFPGKISIAIDARSGYVAVEGWTESTTIRASELAEHLDADGPAGFIYTDIDRDGMMEGPNIDATKDFAARTNTPVILSGGVTTLQDIKNALPLARAGVMGIIIGRALYEGGIDLSEAIDLAER